MNLTPSSAIDAFYGNVQINTITKLNAKSWKDEVRDGRHLNWMVIAIADSTVYLCLWILAGKQLLPELKQKLGFDPY